MSQSELEDMMEVLFSSTVVLTIVGIICLVGIVIFAAYYVLSAIGLYRMAKKAGYDKAWLAWIPYANIWLMFNLPKNEYRVLALNKEISDRSNAFWIYIAIMYGTNIAFMILEFIPIINWIVAILSPLVSVALILANIFMMYPVYKDLFSMFLPESTAKNYAVASMICTYFVPIVPPILMLIASGKDLVEQPVEVIDSSYMYY